MRTPNTTANMVYKMLLNSGRPYAAEVVGDPLGVFSKGASSHPLRRLFGNWFAYHQRRLVSGAVGVSYVTSSRLQALYPAGDGVFSTYYSSIDLPDGAFLSKPLIHDRTDRELHCIFVGSLQFPYKGLDVLLQAMALCLRESVFLSLTVLGDGKEREGLQELARNLGISNRVSFRGRVSPSEVTEFVDKADLFVLPSRTEGLPRALIEAMARGKPCIGSDAGGIPELLPPEDLSPAGDSRLLAQKLTEVAQDTARRARMAERNLEVAAEYHQDRLRLRRNELYSRIRVATEAWLESNQAR